MGEKKNIGVKWVKKGFRDQMGVKKIQVSNECKNIVGVK